VNKEAASAPAGVVMDTTLALVEYREPAEDGAVTFYLDKRKVIGGVPFWREAHRIALAPMPEGEREAIIEGEMLALEAKGFRRLSDEHIAELRAACVNRWTPDRIARQQQRNAEAGAEAEADMLREQEEAKAVAEAAEDAEIQRLVDLNRKAMERIAKEDGSTA